MSKPEPNPKLWGLSGFDWSELIYQVGSLKNYYGPHSFIDWIGNVNPNLARKLNKKSNPNQKLLVKKVELKLVHAEFASRVENCRLKS